MTIDPKGDKPMFDVENVVRDRKIANAVRAAEDSGALARVVEVFRGERILIRPSAGLGSAHYFDTVAIQTIRDTVNVEVR